MFHKITNIYPRDNFELIVQFTDDVTKKYDVKPLFIKYKAFDQLKDINLFNSCKIGVGGYGVIWNDEIDLSSDELYENGLIIKN